MAFVLLCFYSSLFPSLQSFSPFLPSSSPGPASLSLLVQYFSSFVFYFLSSFSSSLTFPRPFISRFLPPVLLSPSSTFLSRFLASTRFSFLSPPLFFAFCFLPLPSFASYMSVTFFLRSSFPALRFLLPAVERPSCFPSFALSLPQFLRLALKGGQDGSQEPERRRGETRMYKEVSNVLCLT